MLREWAIELFTSSIDAIADRFQEASLLGAWPLKTTRRNPACFAIKVASLLFNLSARLMANMVKLVWM
ncbi:MAG: hypothetical protein HC789_17980 [Microcoleus sp. CSU_2_2]|nr:hypothetical protein [Microcoleus sp. SU_5_3]NJS12123.1 hypothetical protein [Microcoleus sp. CSU_2_2]